MMLTISRKMAKLLTVSRKSRHLIENFCQEVLCAGIL